MKKFIVLLISVCFLIPAYSQFQLGHGTKSFEYGKSVRTLHFDEAYILGGQIYSSNTGYDATLLKTRYDGSIMWSKVYGLKGAEIFNSVRPIYQKYDKGYVCLGTTNSIGHGGNDMFFVLTNPVGKPISVFTYGEEAGEDGQCIQVVKDPDFDEPVLIMIGSTRSYTGNSKMFIVKTHLDGTYIDAVFVGYKSNQYGYWIEQTRDGGFIAVGATDYACKMDTVPNLDIFVVKLKSDLNVEWARTIGGGPELPYNDAGYSVKEIEEGYIVTGITQSYGVRNTNDAFLLKLDNNGNLIWMRNYGYTSFDGGFDVLNEENTGVNHQYILNGLTTVNNRYYALLLATNYDGNIMWTRGYGREGYEIGFEMDRTLKPGYVFTGYETSFGSGSADIYHVVTNDIGDSYCPSCEIEPPIKTKKHVPCFSEEVIFEHITTGERKEIEYWDTLYETIPCDTINSKSTESEFSDIHQDIINWNDLTINPGSVNQSDGIKIPDNMNKDNLVLYPNPANDLVRVQYPESYQSGKLKVFNNTGQLVLSRELYETNSTEVTLDKLVNGIYMITVINEKGESLNANLVIAR